MGVANPWAKTLRTFVGQTDEDERVSIHSYDWLVERLEEIAVHPSYNHHAGGVIPYSDEEIREQLDLMSAKPGSDDPGQ